MRSKTTLLVAFAALAIALVAAGCGGSGGYSSSSSAPASSGSYGSYGSAAAPSGAKGAGGAAKVGLTKSPLGRIVVDGKGSSLYLFEKDKGRASNCYGACAAAWPPLLSGGKPATASGAESALLGVTHRTDGSTQVTYAGHPLYRYSGDMAPGQANGEEAQAFGGSWYVLSRAGTKIEQDG